MLALLALLAGALAYFGYALFATSREVTALRDQVARLSSFVFLRCELRPLDDGDLDTILDGIAKATDARTHPDERDDEIGAFLDHEVYPWKYEREDDA